MVEFGFASTYRQADNGPFSAISDLLLSQFRRSNLQLGFMVEAKSAKTVRESRQLAQTLSATTEGFDFIRIAATTQEIDLVNAMADETARSGKRVFVNLMRASELDAQDVTSFFDNLDPAVEGWYLADSFGALSPEKTSELILTISQLSSREVGFHAHNNRGMALANARAAVMAGATMIDGTWAGHGRGSGNARLEELLVEFCLDSLSREVLFGIGNHLESFEYSEGRKTDESSFAYHFGAARGVHPNAVTSLLSSGHDLTLSEVLEALAGSKEDANAEVSADSFVRKAIDESVGVDPKLLEIMGGKHCFVVGSAPSTDDQLLELAILSSADDVVIATLNGAIPRMEFPPKLSFVLHPHRLRQAKVDFENYPTVHVVSPALLDSSDAAKSDVVCAAVVSGSFKGGLVDNRVVLPVGTALAYSLAALAAGGARSITLVGVGGGLDEKRMAEEHQIIAQFQATFPHIDLSYLGDARYGLASSNPWAR